MKIKKRTIKKKRKEKFEEKIFSEKKMKKAYITWDDNDMESSEDSENEEINLCLMAKSYESDEEVTSSNNNLSISFDELQDAFADLHRESIKLAKLVSSSKKTISDLEKEVSKLNKELENLKTEVTISRSNDTIHFSTMPDSKVVSNSCNVCQNENP